jgi:hypothetical protein
LRKPSVKNCTLIDPRLHRIVAAQPHPLFLATISGALTGPGANNSLAGDFQFRLLTCVAMKIFSFLVFPSASRSTLMGCDRHGRSSLGGKS